MNLSKLQMLVDEWADALESLWSEKPGTDSYIAASDNVMYVIEKIQGYGFDNPMELLGYVRLLLAIKEVDNDYAN